MQLNNLALLAVATMLVSCSSGMIRSKKSMTAHSVSMTMQLEDTMVFTPMNKIHSEQCIIHTKAIPGNDSNFLYDELIYQTQKKYDADAILDVSFYDTQGCVTLEGTVAKLVNKTTKVK
jgi:hypothetical protein